MLFTQKLHPKCGWGSTEIPVILTVPSAHNRKLQPDTNRRRKRLDLTALCHLPVSLDDAVLSLDGHLVTRPRRVRWGLRLKGR
jgi:hypothetical protein